MSTVLYTEQAGTGHVFVRRDFEVPHTVTELAWRADAQRRTGEYGTISWYLKNGEIRRIEYSPRPGTIEALGCWSLAGEALEKIPGRLDSIVAMISNEESTDVVLRGGYP